MMGNITALRKELETEGLDERLCRLGCLDPTQVPETARERVRRCDQQGFRQPSGREMRPG